MDKHVQGVEKIFGTCTLNDHACGNCTVRYAELANGGVTMDQDDYVKQLRPMQRPELTGTASEEKATQTVTDMFISLRAALAYPLILQVSLVVYVVLLQRVQEPTNL